LSDWSWPFKVSRLATILRNKKVSKSHIFIYFKVHYNLNIPFLVRIWFLSQHLITPGIILQNNSSPYRLKVRKNFNNHDRNLTIKTESFNIHISFVTVSNYLCFPQRVTPSRVQPSRYVSDLHHKLRRKKNSRKRLPTQGRNHRPTMYFCEPHKLWRK
jgi:hypothetical protein